MKSAISFLLGVAVGVIATVSYQRLVEHAHDEDANALADRLQEQLDNLEVAALNE